MRIQPTRTRVTTHAQTGSATNERSLLMLRVWGRRNGVETGTLGGTAAFSSAVVLSGGTVGYAAGAFGLTGGAAFIAGGVGASAGMYGGMMQTYAADPNAGFGQYALGGGLGAVFGAWMPGAGVGTLAGTLGGAGVGSYYGNASLGAQVGGLVGGIAGGGLHGGWRPMAWEVGGAGIGAVGGYAWTGNAQGALYGANLGMFGAGITRGIAGGVAGLYRRARVPSRAATARISDVGRGSGGHQVMDRISAEAEGAMSQANRILQAGAGKSRWANVYQRVRGRGGFFENMARQNALHSEAERLMMGNRYVLDAMDAGYVVKFNRGSALGMTGPKGGRLRPDIQIGTPTGRWGIIDWTTEGSASKIFKYGVPEDAPWLINVTLP